VYVIFCHYEAHNYVQYSSFLILKVLFDFTNSSKSSAQLPAQHGGRGDRAVSTIQSCRGIPIQRQTRASFAKGWQSHCGWCECSYCMFTLSSILHAVDNFIFCKHKLIFILPGRLLFAVHHGIFVTHAQKNLTFCMKLSVVSAAPSVEIKCAYNVMV